ncbi:MAG: hypothetical protein AB1633_11375, partial [Elusimicrobiota bacterium]
MKKGAKNMASRAKIKNQNLFISFIFIIIAIFLNIGFTSPSELKVSVYGHVIKRLVCAGENCSGGANTSPSGDIIYPKPIPIPIEGVKLTFIARIRCLPNEKCHIEPVVSYTDANGYYEVKDLMKDIEYTVTASHEGYQEQTKSIATFVNCTRGSWNDPLESTEPLCNHNFRLDFSLLEIGDDTLPLVTASGFVKEIDNSGIIGPPISGAMVYFVSSVSPVLDVNFSIDPDIRDPGIQENMPFFGKVAITNKDGYYEMPGLAAELTYRVTASANGYESQIKFITPVAERDSFININNCINGKCPNANTLDFELEKKHIQRAMVWGKVVEKYICRDNNGACLPYLKPISGAKISFEEVNYWVAGGISKGENLITGNGITYTNEYGCYNMRGLKVGAFYRVEASKEGYIPQVKFIHPQEDPFYEVDNNIQDITDPNMYIGLPLPRNRLDFGLLPIPRYTNSDVSITPPSDIGVAFLTDFRGVVIRWRGPGAVIIVRNESDIPLSREGGKIIFSGTGMTDQTRDTLVLAKSMVVSNSYFYVDQNIGTGLEYYYTVFAYDPNQGEGKYSSGQSFIVRIPAGVASIYQGNGINSSFIGSVYMQSLPNPFNTYTKISYILP